MLTTVVYIGSFFGVVILGLLTMFLIRREDPTRCIFCKIVSKKIPSSVVYEDSEFMVFRDISPASKVHLLMIPKAHMRAWTNLNSQILSRMESISKKVVQDLAQKQELTDSESVHVGFTNAAWNTVGHVHMHMVSLPLTCGWFRGIFLSKPSLFTSLSKALDHFRKSN